MRAGAVGELFSGIILIAMIQVQSIPDVMFRIERLHLRQFRTAGIYQQRLDLLLQLPGNVREASLAQQNLLRPKKSHHKHHPF